MSVGTNSLARLAPVGAPAGCDFPGDKAPVPRAPHKHAAIAARLEHEAAQQRARMTAFYASRIPNKAPPAKAPRRARRAPADTA